MTSATDTAVVAPSDRDGVTPARRRVNGRGALQAGLFALPVLIFLGAGWVHRTVAEDAFIYLRVVRQVRAGHGPVFNIGQRVEAFTGSLWVFILSIADLVTPIRLEWLAVTLSLACGAAGVTMAMIGARRLWSDAASTDLYLPLGALVFVALLPVWVYSGNGLETGLVFGWLGTCLWILAAWARTPERRLSLPCAVFLGLGWLVRPEMALFSALFFVLVLVADRGRFSRADQLKVAVAMLALPVAYQIFRMGYYGSLVPNTAIAKEGSNADWARGARYFRDFVDPYWLWVPVVALLVGGYLPLAAQALRRTRVLCVAGAFVLGAVLIALYVVAIGGDYLHARLLLPSFFAFCAPVAAIPATRRCLAALIVLPWALVAGVSLKPDQYKGNFLAHGFVMTMPAGYQLVTVEDNGWGASGRLRRWYRGPAYYWEAGTLNYITADLPLDPNLPLPYGAFYGVGVSGYALGTNFHMLDLLGLADSFTAHLETTPSEAPIPRFAGHEKPLPAPWIAARVTRPGSRPSARDFPNFGNNPLIPPTRGTKFEEQVAWARAALKCGGIAQVLAAADTPMTPGRFFSNFVHSFSNTRTRIPPDPEAAYHKFCGSGTPPEVRALQSGGSG